MAQKDELKAGLIFTVGIIGALLLILILLLAQVMFYHAQRWEERGKVEQARWEQLVSLTARQEALLQGYRVVDAREGVVAIPIDRAMDLVVKEHAGPEKTFTDPAK